MQGSARECKGGRLQVKVREPVLRMGATFNSYEDRTLEGLHWLTSFHGFGDCWNLDVFLERRFKARASFSMLLNPPSLRGPSPPLAAFPIGSIQ